MEKNATAISNLNLSTSLVANDYLIIVRNANSALPDRISLKIAAGNAFPQLYGGPLNVGSNIVINTSTISVGNSTQNSVVNAIGFFINGVSSDVAGSNTQIQFNDSGVFGANVNFIYDKATASLSIGNTDVNASMNSTTFFINDDITAGDPTFIANTSLLFIGLDSGSPFLRFAGSNLVMYGDNTQISVGNDVVNAVVNGSGFSVSGNVGVTTNVVWGSNTLVIMGGIIVSVTST